MFPSKKSCGRSFTLAHSCLVFIFILAHSTVLTLATSGEESYLRREISQLSKTKETVQNSYDDRRLENDGSHAGHSHSDRSHSGRSHSGEEIEASAFPSTPSTSAVVSDATEESQYQLNQATASSYEQNPASTVIILFVSMLYAGVAFGLFLLIRRNENVIEDDQKIMPLVSLPSMETIQDENKLAVKCCAIIGVRRPTGLVNMNSFNIA